MTRTTVLLALVTAAGIAGTSLAEPIVIDKAGKTLRVVEADRKAPKPKLTLHTTMATWCVACKVELPQLVYLRSVFKPEELRMVGLPYDEKEGPDRLKAWVGTNHPPYELVTSLSTDQISSVKAMVLATFRMDAVPAAFITDADGRVLRAKLGPPSVSELRELLRSQKERK